MAITLGHFRTIIRRYKWVLTIVGALIVFSTTLRKEGKQERLKSLADSIGSNRSIFLIRGDIARVAGSARNRNDRVQEVATLNSEMDIVSNFLEETRDRINNDSAITAGEMDLFDRDAEKKLQSLRNREEKLDKRYKKIAEKIEDLDRDDAGSVPVEKLEIDGQLLSERIVDMFWASMHLNNDTIDFTTNVFKQAEQLEQRVKADYENYKKMSLFLYAVGWGVGLLGQLVGLEAQESA